MFDKIFEFIASIWEWLIPWVVLDEYEAGVVLQLGKYRRTIGPGFWFICPFGIDKVKYDTVVRQTSYLDVQSLTSKDGKNVTISGIVVFTISDIKKFLLEIDDGETDMTNIVYGIITDTVENTDWKDIRGQQFNTTVNWVCGDECIEYCGVEILAIKWSDKATSRNLRLWND